MPLPRKRVAPAKNNNEIIEIRKCRLIRVQHINKKPRDEQLSNELKNNSLNLNKEVVSGPLTMPKHMSASTSVNGFTRTSNTSSEMMSTLKNTEADSDATTLNMSPVRDASLVGSLKDSPGREISNNKIRSASSVQLTENRLAGKVCETLTDSNVESLGKEMGITEKEGDISLQKDDISRENMSNATIDKSVSKGNKSEKFSRKSISKENPDNNCALFFIHGVGGSSDIWCGQIKFFSELGYEIIAPDLIGHGFSCTPKSSGAYHFKEIATDMEEIFDRFCKRQNIVVGHSYGASFATLLARNRARRVTKLVLISGGPPTPLAPQPGVFSLPSCLLHCFKPCLMTCFYKGAFHQDREPIVSKDEAFNIPTYVLKHMMNGQDWLEGDAIYHSWLTCPCLLIYGAQDQLVSLDEEEETASAIFGSQLKVIEDASHMVMIEAPDEVNQLISDFILSSTDSFAEQSTESDKNVSALVTSNLEEHHIKAKRRASLKSAKSRRRGMPKNLLRSTIKV